MNVWFALLAAVALIVCVGFYVPREIYYANGSKAALKRRLRLVVVLSIVSTLVVCGALWPFAPDTLGTWVAAIFGGASLTLVLQYLSV